MRKHLCISVLSIGLGLASAAANAATIVTGIDIGNDTTQYQLDFGGSGNTVGGGNWTGVPLKNSSGATVSQLTPTTDPEAISLGEEGRTLTMSGTFGYWLGGNSDTNPVVKSGWYFTNANAQPAPTFTIGGLTAGDKVSLWATYSWDGLGKAPRVSLGGNELVDLRIEPLPAAEAGTNPGTADLKLIAADVVATASTMSGAFAFPSNGNGEGQVGAFIISVQSVPEPASLAMLIGGPALLALRRRRA